MIPVHPLAVVCLGATAASSLLGSEFELSQSRGKLMRTPWAEVTMATWHPSLALRARGAESRARVIAELTEDFGRLAKRIGHRSE